jgi:hypothetical protein
MKSNIILFVFINFIIGFVSDIFLNYFSKQFKFLSSLKPYFKNQSVIKCAIDAGLTIIFALFINMFISYYLLGFIIPNNSKQLLYFCILAFILGYILDIIIYKIKIFGNRLNTYYKKIGPGFWGASAFVFSIVISYIIKKYVSYYL